jgi:hypothetical protein
MLKLLLSILFIQLCASKLTLQLTRVSTKELNGIFFDPETATGLVFKSTKYSLTLTNANGKSLLEYSPLISVPAAREDFTVHILGTYYPSNQTDLEGDELIYKYIESEAKYLPDLYYAMADLGIKGTELPSAMGVYTMALGFHKHQGRYGKNRLAPCRCDCPEAIHIAECLLDIRGPPQCCDCIGQCGACGSCWTYVCDSCCWRLGCCGHDICCYTNNAGCLFPIGLQCEVKYGCSAHNNACCDTGAPRKRMDTCPVASFGCDCNTAECCSGGPWEGCHKK